MSRMQSLVGILILMFLISPLVRRRRRHHSAGQRGEGDQDHRAVEQDLASLTDDQKQKIADIHSKALEQMKQVRDTEKADIMALLTDDQKAELKKAGSEDTGGRERKRKRIRRTPLLRSEVLKWAGDQARNPAAAWRYATA